MSDRNWLFTVFVKEEDERELLERVGERGREYGMGGERSGELGEIGGRVGSDDVGRHEGRAAGDPMGIGDRNGDILEWIYQLERCPESSRLHWQGYVRLRSKVRIKGAQRIIGFPTAHMERRKGSHQQATDYCSKQESRVAGPWSGGVPMAQGHRQDLDDLAVSIRDSGLTERDVARSNPHLYCRYRSGIKDLCRFALEDKLPDFRTVDVRVFHGIAGSGKTRAAIASCDGDYFILDAGERVWFDGYTGQKTLIIDDFYGWIKWGTFLRILDGYKFRCEVKGNFTWAQWTTIIITSNKHPDAWYEKGFPPELERRISSITHFPIDREE